LQVGRSLADGCCHPHRQRVEWRRPRPSGHLTAVVFQMHAGDNYWHCYRLLYPRRPAQYICHQRQADTERRDVTASVLPSILSPPVRCPDNIRLTLRVKQANENVGYNPVMDYSVECVRSTIDKYTCERCRQRQHMPRYAHVFIFE